MCADQCTEIQQCFVVQSRTSSWNEAASKVPNCFIEVRTWV